MYDGIKTLELKGFVATSESAASLCHALRRSSIETVRLINCSLGPLTPGAAEPDFGPAYSIPIVAPMPLRGTLWAERSSGFVHAAALAWSPRRLVLIDTPTTPWPIACAHRRELTAVHLDDGVDHDVLGELALNASITIMSLFLRPEAHVDMQAVDFLRQVLALLSESESAFPGLGRLVIRYPPVGPHRDYYGMTTLRATMTAARFPGRALVVIAEDARDDEDQAAFVRRVIEAEEVPGASQRGTIELTRTAA